MSVLRHLIKRDVRTYNNAIEHHVDLAPGEDCVVTLRYAQLLQVEQGTLRLLVPIVIALRYGTAECKLTRRRNITCGHAIPSISPSACMVI